ncbi:LysM peptidoglycan-binding domain-containing protein, partial [Marinobacterium sp. D7]|uniref:LysM peptidoglycan-binding domain-containing protein n=1 Tax=Marinobacterium ramblicola TaxID=2849041 RepID=UPI001C2D2FCB
GRLTADTHVVYDEGDIIGSTLPNLKSDPDDGGCGGFLAIIITIVVAIIAFYTLQPQLFAALQTTLGATGAYIASAAITAAVASVVSQGILIGLGYQDEFSWKQVAADAVSAAFSAGAGVVAGTAGKLAQAGKTLQYAKVATAALRVASVASKQLILNGKITSWTSLAAAGIGGALEAGQAEAMGNLNRVGANTAEGAQYLQQIQTLSQYQTALEYATPWVQLAETSVRNDGQLQPGDWVAAVGGTLDTALTSGLGIDNIADPLKKHLAQQGLNAAIGGAMSLYDKDAALGWLQSEVGKDFDTYLRNATRLSVMDAQMQGVASDELAGSILAKPDNRMGVLVANDPDEIERINQQMAQAPTGAGVEKADFAAFEEVIIRPDPLPEGRARGFHPEGVTIDESGSVSYKIGEGDNLSTIAQGLGSTVEELAAYNNIDNPDLIIAGQTLRKPPVGYADYGEVLSQRQTQAELGGAGSADPQLNPEKYAEGGVADPSLNSRYVTMNGRNGKSPLYQRIFSDEGGKGGQITRSPFDSRELSKSRAFDSGLEVKVAEMTFFETGNSYTNSIGITFENAAALKGGFVVNKDGINANISANALAQTKYFEEDFGVGVGTVKVSGQTVGEAGANANFVIGPAKYASGSVDRVNISAGAKAQAVAIQYSGDFKSNEYSVGPFDMSASGHGEINVVGIGGKLEGGIRQTQTGSWKLTAGAGLTPLVGGSLKGTLEVKFNQQWIDDNTKWVRSKYDELFK